MFNVVSFRQFFVTMLHSKQLLVIFATRTWSLWRKRNVQLQDNKLRQLSRLAEYTLQTKLSQTTDLNATSRMKVECWPLPPTTFVKCNINVAVFMQEHKVNIEECLRNKIGQYIAVFSYYISVAFKPIEAEAWVCKLVVEDVNHFKPDTSEYSFIINKCHTFVSNFQDYIVVFSRQQTETFMLLHRQLYLNSSNISH
jgi:hypothetical protein